MYVVDAAYTPGRVRGRIHGAYMVLYVVDAAYTPGRVWEGTGYIYAHEHT